MYQFISYNIQWIEANITFHISLSSSLYSLDSTFTKLTIPRDSDDVLYSLEHIDEMNSEELVRFFPSVMKELIQLFSREYKGIDIFSTMVNACISVNQSNEKTIEQYAYYFHDGGDSFHIHLSKYWRKHLKV